MNYNLHRLPYGAQTFSDEVQNLYPKAEILPDERDGLGVYRRLDITFDTFEEAEHLGKLLVPIMESADPRIIAWVVDADTISVMFTGLDEAENPEPFHLARVADTLLPPTTAAKKAAKKPAKKAAPKT